MRERADDRVIVHLPPATTTSTGFPRYDDHPAAVTLSLSERFPACIHVAHVQRRPAAPSAVPISKVPRSKRHPSGRYRSQRFVRYRGHTCPAMDGCRTFLVAPQTGFIVHKLWQAPVEFGLTVFQDAFCDGQAGVASHRSQHDEINLFSRVADRTPYSHCAALPRRGHVSHRIGCRI